MKRLVILGILVLGLGITFSAAQETGTEEEFSPGVFTPDSALYGLETGWDSIAMSAGISSPEHVAQKRAAEAREMAEQGNYEAAESAATGLENAAERAGEDEAPGIEQATETITEVIDEAPEEAQEGLQNALENVQERGPEGIEVGPPEDRGPEESGPPEDQAPEDPEPPEEEPEPPVEEQAPDQPEDEETGEEQAGEETEDQEVDRTVEIQGGPGTNYETDEVSVEEGETVEFVYQHEGGQHDLVLERDGERVEGTEVLSTSGESDSFTYIFDEEGDYEFYCSVGSHRAQGMEGDIVFE